MSIKPSLVSLQLPLGVLAFLFLYSCELGVLQPAENKNGGGPSTDPVSEEPCSIWGGGSPNGKVELDLPGFMLTAPIPADIPVGYHYLLTVDQNYLGLEPNSNSIFIAYEHPVLGQQEAFHSFDGANPEIAVNDRYFVIQEAGNWQDIQVIERQHPSRVVVASAPSAQVQGSQVLDISGACGFYYGLIKYMGVVSLLTYNGNDYSSHELGGGDYVKMTTIYQNDRVEIVLYDNERHGLDIMDSAGAVVQSGLGLLLEGVGIDLAADQESIYMLTQTEENYFIHRVFLAGGIAEEVLVLEPDILTPTLFINNKRLYIRFALPGDSPRVYQVR